MAIGSGTVFQIQSTATAGNVNGGAFNPGNANGITDGVIASGTGNSPTLTSATYSFAAGDVNHWIFFPTQTNMISGWYQIASQSGGVATLKAAIGQAQIITNNMFGTNTSAGCATTGAPTGVTYLVDYSQTDTARYSSSTLTGTTTTATDAGGNPFTAQMVGNFISMASGTGVTAGWYEIVSVTTGTATLSSSPGATYSVVVCKIGGAVSLGGSTTGITDTLFFALGQTSATASARYFIKGGSSITYTLGQTISAGTTSNTTWPVIIESYASTRGDRPTGTTRPTLALAANTFNLTSGWFLWGCIFTGTAATIVAPASSCQIFYCKCVNSSTTAGRVCFGLNSGTPTSLTFCEAVSYRGNAISAAGSSQIVGCYIHDSDKGVHYTASGGNMIDTILSGCVTAAFDNTSATTTPISMVNNTFYGAENKLGKGLNLLTATVLLRSYNNIFYGFTTAITHADTQTSCLGDYNCFFNNTNDVSSAAAWQKGPHDIALNPTFTNVGQVTGTTATTTAGNHLVDAGASFITAGVTAGQDYLYVISGTGVTAGVYGIASVDSATQITTDIAITANATGDKTYQITTGRNWSPGTNLKATGFPGAFQGAVSTSYLDIGAVQRQEPSATSGSFTFGS